MYESEPSGQPRMTALLMLLILVVVLGSFTALQVRSLHGRLDQMQGNYRSDFMSLLQRVEGIGGGMRTLEEEAQWYASPQVTVDEATLRAIQIGWVFRELGHEAEVGLSYRFSGEDEWQEAEVVADAPLAFHAWIREGIVLRPHFEIGLSRAQDIESPPSRAVEVVGPVTSESGGTRVEYVIWASDAQGLRSGAREVMDLSRFADMYHVDIHIRDAGTNLRILMAHRIRGPWNRGIQSVEVILYDGDQEVFRDSLQDLGEEHIGDFYWDEAPVFDQLGMLVTYPDGESVQEIVYIGHP